MIINQEIQKEVFNSILEAVGSVIAEFREAYHNARNISSPHLIPEITAAIAGQLDDISQGQWSLERKKGTRDKIAIVTANVISQYSKVYPAHAAVSSPHLPETIASRVMVLIDDFVHQITRVERKEPPFQEKPREKKSDGKKASQV